jgi:hypothetical protein
MQFARTPSSPMFHRKPVGRVSRSAELDDHIAFADMQPPAE